MSDKSYFIKVYLYLCTFFAVVQRYRYQRMGLCSMLPFLCGFLPKTLEEKTLNLKMKLIVAYIIYITLRYV